MKHSAWLLLFCFAAGPQYASAQQAGPALNEIVACVRQHISRIRR